MSHRPISTMSTSSHPLAPKLAAPLATPLLRPVARPLLAAVLTAALLALLACVLPHWPLTARLALGVFALAVIGWTVLRLDEAPVALAACLALVGLGGVSAPTFYASLGDSLIWLLLGAFVLAAVLQQSGLAERWALRAVAGAGTVQGLLTRLTWLIIGSAFLVPSTSGRAALLLPVFVVLARSIGDTRITRALTLLFPSVILLSACASLLGAGAHLVAVDFMRHMGHTPPSFIGWAVLAAPFAVISSFAASFMIGRLFLSAAQRQQPLQLPAPDPRPLTRPQRSVLVVTLLAVVGWSTGELHGIDASAVALSAALAATFKPLTAINLKAALKGVEWSVILFLAATLVLGEALLHTGAAQLLTAALLQTMPLATLGLPGALAVAVMLALLSHLVITSRTARALVLLPTVALPLAAVGVNPALLIFVTVIGSGFCQTLLVSAKPIAVFARADLPVLPDPPGPHERSERTIEADLMRLALALLPVLGALLMLFALVVWPLQGLALRA